MTSKYADLAKQAIAVVSEIDLIERELTSRASLLVRGYSAYIEAPTGSVSFVETDETARALGPDVPLSQQAPLAQRAGGLWWIGMKIVYRDPEQSGDWLAEVVPMGLSSLGKEVTGFKVEFSDGKSFEIRREEDLGPLFEHIRVGTETRLRELVAGGKRPIGFRG